MCWRSCAGAGGGSGVRMRQTLFVAVGGVCLAGVWLAFSPVAHLRAMPVAE